MADDRKAQAAFDAFVQLWTTGTTGGRRAPVLRRPDEVGLDYEDVFFPSMDGVPLEGWFIPADSDRLVIHNHFLPGNRYGYPGHLPEFGGLGGFEVSFLPERTGFHLDEQSPVEHVGAVRVPTLVAQVHDDTMTRPEDVQSINDALTVADRDLHWIRGTSRRFDGCNYLGEHPEVPINWFDKYVR